MPITTYNYRADVIIVDDIEEQAIPPEVVSAFSARVKAVKDEIKAEVKEEETFSIVGIRALGDSKKRVETVLKTCNTLTSALRTWSSYADAVSGSSYYILRKTYKGKKQIIRRSRR